MKGYLKPASWEGMSYKQVQKKLADMRSSEKNLGTKSGYELPDYVKEKLNN